MQAESWRDVPGLDSVAHYMETREVTTMKTLLFTLSLLATVAVYGATAACNQCRQSEFIKCYNASFNVPHTQRLQYCNNISYKVCKAKGKC